MNELNKTLENLLHKSIEVNKSFIEEGVKLLQRYSEGGKQFSNLNVFQNKVLSNALTDYVDLNVKYVRSLVDLSMDVLKDMGGKNESNQTSPSEEEPPSFVLEKTAAAGTTVPFQFLLDNVKPETVMCRLVSSVFVADHDGSENAWKTSFNPQAFTLNKEESRLVSITVDIPKETPPGRYISKVHVEGFEPAYFSIRLTVTAIEALPVHVSKKAAGKKRK